MLAGNILQMVQKLGFNIKEVGQDEKFPRSLSQSEQFALDTLLETREFHIPLRDATLSLQFSSAGVRCDLWRATDDKSSNLGICMLSNNIAAERVTRFLNFYSKFPKADLKILWDRNIVGITVDMEVAG